MVKTRSPIFQTTEKLRINSKIILFKNEYSYHGRLGFIGGHFLTRIKDNNSFDKIIVFDKMTYASNYKRLKNIFEKKNFLLVKGDIASKSDVRRVFHAYKPNIVINFAAESHVDNSINKPDLFLDVNTKGTLNLLIEAKKLWINKNNVLKEFYKKSIFYQISTDEVFGSLSKINSFDEKSPYSPNSPIALQRQEQTILSKHSTKHIIFQQLYPTVQTILALIKM